MIHVFKYDERAIIPTRANPTDAGMDLYAIEDVFIPMHTTVKIDLGLAIEVPIGMVGKIEDRSSIGARGIKVSGGVVDSLYTGALSVILTNMTYDKDTEQNMYGSYVRRGYQIKAGDRIAQLLMYKVETVGICEIKELWDSPKRGNKGLGSSGR